MDAGLDAEQIHQCRHVIGAVFEAESRGSNAAAMTAMVDRDHPEVLSEEVEGASPVEPGGGTQAVQEQENRGARRARDFADERAPPAGEFHHSPGRNVCPIDFANHYHD
jgi:hypothetical protein